VVSFGIPTAFWATMPILALESIHRLGLIEVGEVPAAVAEAAALVVVRADRLHRTVEGHPIRSRLPALSSSFRSTRWSKGS
jgi:hypothetical protein